MIGTRERLGRRAISSVVLAPVLAIALMGPCTAADAAASGHCPPPAGTAATNAKSHVHHTAPHPVLEHLRKVG